MPHIRGKFGIEYIPEETPRDFSLMGRIALGVFVIALFSFAATLFHRWRHNQPPEATAMAELAQRRPELPPPPAVEKKSKPPPAQPSIESDVARRPREVRNLLMRLDEEVRSGNIVGQIRTIEQIRALPGQPAADLDDKLARQLGDLNWRWLFELRNAQWVAQVTVKRGDSASRIAKESGSTLGSLMKLNNMSNADKIIVGHKVHVMDNPRFNLIVRKKPGIADLQLNGKFFRRYDLYGKVGGEAGAYETPANLRTFLSSMGIAIPKKEESELEMIIPKGSSLIISEY